MLPKVKKVLFAPGAGGNWLIHAINNMPMNGNGVNFHRHTWTAGSALMEQTHHVPQGDFVFFHGDLTLNFFLNSIFKYWFKEHHAGTDQTWFMNKMLRNWSVIVDLACFDRTPDLSWQVLLYQPEQSYEQLIGLQRAHKQQCMTFLNYMHRRQCLLDTMLPTRDVYQNWDSEFWVLAVLADLRYTGWLDADWQFDSQHSWDHYRQMAFDHFTHCKNIWHFSFENSHSVPLSIAQCLAQNH